MRNYTESSSDQDQLSNYQNAVSPEKRTCYLTQISCRRVNRRLIDKSVIFIEDEAVLNKVVSKGIGVNINR